MVLTFQDHLFLRDNFACFELGDELFNWVLINELDEHEEFLRNKLVKPSQSHCEIMHVDFLGSEKETHLGRQCVRHDDVVGVIGFLA